MGYKHSSVCVCANEQIIPPEINASYNDQAKVGKGDKACQDFWSISSCLFASVF